MSKFKVITGGRDGGDGPEDPMLDKRVEALEADMKQVRASLNEIKTTLSEMNAQMVKSSDVLKLATDVAQS